MHRRVSGITFLGEGGRVELGKSEDVGTILQRKVDKPGDDGVFDGLMLAMVNILGINIFALCIVLIDGG